MSQTEPLRVLHSPSLGHACISHDNDMNKLASSSQVVPDFPPWTPLRAHEDEESSSASDQEADELATRKEADSAMKQTSTAGPPTNAQATAENTVARRTPVDSSLSDARPSKVKKARFDGVLIATKPRFYRKFSAHTQSGRASPASSAHAFSLVDALARTFDANRHTEDPFSRRSRWTFRQRDDGSTGPQTDVETTEAEDEQLQLNTRLIHTPLKRPRGRRGTIAVSANVAEINSEDAASLAQPERSAKRLKAISYEANSALIDEALGTVQASISWDTELDIMTRDDNFVTSAQTVHTPAADVRVDVDADNVTARSPRRGHMPASTQTPVENAWRMPTPANPKHIVLLPYLSRGANFRQRLYAVFGENATVRTDKVARPRPVDYELYSPPDLDEHERASSPSVSESTESVSAASTAEELASAIPSTHITSQSPDIPPADTSIMDLLPTREEALSAADASSTMPALGASDEQMNGWIVALQRLVKGKVRIKEEDLETLSIILAEIESVKDNLDQKVQMTSELRESVRQLSKLYEIPFGDRNKLRQRAGNIFHTWPSVGELVTS